ncbi:hypothetical protein E2320_002380, partial [Naja naja]
MADTQKFTPFDPELVTWDSLVQFDCNFEANELTNITDNRKRAIFLSNCGRKVFEMARTIIAPDPPADSPIGHVNTETDPALCSQIFLHCKVACILPEGPSRGLQRRLLARATHMLKEAVDEAVASEQSGRSAEEIQMRKSNSLKIARWAATVHREETENIGGDEDADDSEENIHKMRVAPQGHLAHICYAAFPAATPPNTEKGSSNHPHSRKRSQVKGKNREENCFTIHTNPRPVETISHQSGSLPNKKIHVTVDVEGAPCRIEVDTGLAMTIISQTTLDDIIDKKKQQKLKLSRVRLWHYLGNNIPTVGSSKFFVKYGQFAGYLPLVVTKGSLSSLLGLDWFASLGLGVT